MPYGRLNYLASLYPIEAISNLAWTSRKLTVSTLFALALVCAGLTPLSAIAQSELDRITLTWTGLEKFRNQLSVVKLVIETAQTSGQSNPVQGGSPGLSGQTGLPVTGTISHQPALAGRRGGLAPAEIEDITGDFFPAINLLRFRIAGPWSGGSIMYAVLGENNTDMAVVYTGAGRNNLPYLLSAGDDFPAQVERFVPGAPAGIVAQRAQAQALVNGQSEYLQQVQALQLEVVAAASAGDQQRMIQLQQEMRQLQQDMQQQQRQQLQNQTANGGGTIQQRMQAALMKVQEAAQSGDPAVILAAQQEYQQVIMGLSTNAGIGSAQPQECPDTIVNWAEYMNAQGASFVEFTGTIQVSNLFRPSVFAQFFGTTFADMSASEKFETAGTIQRLCVVQGSQFYTSANTTSMMSAFGEQGGYSMVDAGIASLALEHIANWLDSTLTALQGSGTWEDLRQLEALYPPLLTAIWPMEAQAANTRLDDIKNVRGYESLRQQLTQLATQLDAQGITALRNIGAIRQGLVYQDLNEATKIRFNQFLENELSQTLPRYVGRFTESSVSASTMQALTDNRVWYAGHADIFDRLADVPSVAAYRADLGRQREAAFAALRQQMNTDLAGLNSRAAVAAYGSDFVLALDDQYAPSWQAVEQRRAERIVEVEWEVHVARVGEGPFSPDHPGAVYLNAIYRNDLVTIKEEDSTYAQPFRSFMAPISQSGFFELVPFFTGGVFSADDMQNYLEREIDNMTVVDTLAGFFVVSYQHAYSSCMDASPVQIERTVFWDTVTTDGWGNELWRTTDSQTYHYTLNRRHVPVFNEVGVGQDPEQVDMLSSMFGAFLPQNLKGSYSILSDALRGLRLGMQQFDCSSPEMQQLEQRLTALALR